MAARFHIALDFGELRMTTQDAEFDIYNHFWNSVHLNGCFAVDSRRISATLDFRAFVNISLDWEDIETRSTVARQVGFFNFLTSEIIQSVDAFRLPSNCSDIVDFVVSAIVDACEVQCIELGNGVPFPSEQEEAGGGSQSFPLPACRLGDTLPRISAHVLLNDDDGILMHADLRLTLARRLPEHGLVGCVDLNRNENDELEFYRDLDKALEQICGAEWSLEVEVSFSLTDFLEAFGRSIGEGHGVGLILHSRHVLVALYDLLDALSDVLETAASDWVGREIARRIGTPTPPPPQPRDEDSSSYNPSYKQKMERLLPLRRHAERQRHKLEFRFENQAITAVERGSGRRQRLLLCLTAEKGSDREGRTVGTFGVSTETLDGKNYDGVVFCIEEVESYLNVPMSQVREAIQRSYRSQKAGTYSFRVYIDEADRSATFFSPDGPRAIDISRHVIPAS